MLSRLAPKLDLPLRRADQEGRTPATAARWSPSSWPRTSPRSSTTTSPSGAAQFPGVGLEETYLRTYPQGDLAAHVLGQVGKISADQIDDYRRRGYAGNEIVGKGGIEQEYEQFLKGTPGRDVVEVDAAGEPVGREVVSSRAPSPGHDIQLSIDGPTQRAMRGRAAPRRSSLGSSTGAAGVALDPAHRRGPGAWRRIPPTTRRCSSTARTKQIDRVNTSPDTPALNRAIAGRYPSGSTFKLDHRLGGARGRLHHARASWSTRPPRSTLYKQVFPNFKNIAHGEVNLPRALEVSSDTYFYKLGDRFYRGAGLTRCRTRPRTSAWAGTPGSTCPASSPGWCPTPAWKRRNYAGPAFNDLDRDWKPGDTIQLAVGQGYLLVTPLQMAVAYAADGRRRHRAHADPGARACRTPTAAWCRSSRRGARPTSSTCPPTT